MKDEVNDRILKLINSKKMTSQKFASMLNVQSSNISHITSKRNKPSFDLLFNILSVFPEISADWLLMGAGEMYRDGNEDINENTLNKVPLKPVVNVVEGELFEEKPTTINDSEPIQPIISNSTLITPNKEQEMTLFDGFYDNRSEYPINNYDTMELNALFNTDQSNLLSIKDVPQNIYGNDFEKEGYDALPVDLVENSTNPPHIEAITELEVLDNKILDKSNTFIHTEALNEIVTQDIVVENTLPKKGEEGIKDNTILNKQVCDEPIKEVISSNSNADNAKSIPYEKEQSESQQQIPVIGVGRNKKVDKILLLFDDNTYQEFFGK